LLILQCESIRSQVSDKLESAGFNVILASNSIKAVTFLRSRQVILVITEVEIGDVDGWRLSRLIRSGILASGENLSILLITQNHCERIAETTAGMFDIDRVMSFQEIDYVDEVATQVLNGQGNFNKAAKNALRIEW